MKKIKLGSDCCGVGSLIQAVKRLGIDYDETFACDFDYYARLNYCIQYGTEKDIEIAQSKQHKKYCDEVKRIALMDASIEVCDEDKQILVDANEFAKTFSFYFPFNMYEREVPVEPIDLYMSSIPCQAFSLAGKRLGKQDKRGILFFSSLDFIRENKPRYFIFENVKGLISHDKTDKKAKYGKTFSEWINYLGGKSINGNATFIPYEDSVPYHIYFQVLNAKEHGVPQNRERIFIVGIRDDADNNFRFPIKEVLKLRLKDVLETIVDEKYFLSDKMVEYMITRADNFNNDKINYKDEESIASTITKSSGSIDISDNIIKVGFINQDTQASQVYSDNGVSPNMCAGTHGYANGYVESDSNTNDEADIINPLKDKTEYGWHFEQNVYSEDSVCRTIKSSEGSGNKPKVIVDEVIVHNVNKQVKVRKYNVDIDSLQKCLKENKIHTILEISEYLQVPKTMVEHWFRTDKHFSIPDSDIWIKLKEYLNIKTDIFDESIMTFEEKDNVFEKSNRIYDANGIMPTIDTSCNQEIIVDKTPEVRQLNPSKESGGKQPFQQNRVYDVNGVMTTLDTDSGRKNILIDEPNPIVEYQLTGGKWDKTHEQSGRVYSKDGVAPTIHTMGGGNQEPKIIVEQEPNIIQLGRGYNKGGEHDICPPITSNSWDRNNYLNNKRIRRLTPTEVMRLMDFDESFMDNVRKYNKANPKNTLSDSNYIVKAATQL